MPKKTLYHSELVKLGPVMVEVMSDVLPSKFRNQPDFVVLKIDGEERTYSTENEDCAAFFDGQKGERFALVAEGRKDEASITWVGEVLDSTAHRNKPPARNSRRRDDDDERGNTRGDRDDAPKGQKRSSRPPPKDRGRGDVTRGDQERPPEDREPEEQRGRREEPPAQPATAKKEETPEERLLRVRVHAAKVANCWMIAFVAGLYAKEHIKSELGLAIDTDQFNRLVSTICVQLEKDGMHRLMQAQPIALRKKNGDHPAPAPANKTSTPAK